MNHSRRVALRHGTALVTTLIACSRLPLAQAAEDRSKGFDAKAFDEVMKALGAERARPGGDIIITAPPLAENGGTVPIEVTSRIAQTRTIAVVVEKNPFPLAAVSEPSPQADAFASLRLKLSENTDVYAVVTTEAGDVYTAMTHIRVAAGGCGG